MGLRDYFELVLENYASARTENFSNHHLALFIRNTFPSYLSRLTDEPERYTFSGSAGKGNWARAPWIAVFDVLITHSAQSGYYPVYLFREDFTGIYWGLNQGVTEAKEHYRSDAKTALAAKAVDYRAQVHGLTNNFSEQEIDLHASGSTNLSSYYEAGNICAKFYSAQALPSENTLVNLQNKGKEQPCPFPHSNYAGIR